jgi:hypothetical protein
VNILLPCDVARSGFSPQSHTRVQGDGKGHDVGFFAARANANFGEEEIFTIVVSAQS